MFNEEKKIGAIYTRVSTTDQAREGHSLEEQENRLRHLCEINGYELYEVYSDPAISGKSTENRPRFQQMMKDMRKGKFNLILAYKMDRISRSVLDFENFFNETRKYNCGIELLCEKIDTSGASGIMFARQLANFANFERDLIKERTLIGVESAVNKAHFGGIPPIGYMKEVIDGKKTKKWVINEEEVPMVKEVYDLCLKGKTYFQISTVMKEKYPNIIAFIRKDKETNEEIITYRSWTDSSISAILNNKCYIGTYEYRRKVKDKETIEIPNIVPRIIEENVFYECQDNIKRNMRNYYRSVNYLFMQKLICPKCGITMACSATKPRGKNYLYYKCKDCKTYFREDLIEKATIKELTKLLELYLILEDNYIAIDSETAEELCKGKIDNTVRYAFDIALINKKRSNTNYIPLNYIWDLVSYEGKCKFVYEYIDTIKVKQHGKKNKTTIELLDLNLKPHKIKQFFEMKKKNMLDPYLDSSINCSVFKSRKQADDYIEVLMKNYDIKVIDTSIDKDYYINSNVFRAIKIISKNVVEKNNILYLELAT